MDSPRPGRTEGPPAGRPDKAVRLRLITALLVMTMALIWAFIAVRFYTSPQPGGVPPWLWGVLAAVSMVNSALHLLAAWFVQQRNRWGHVFAVVLVSVNLVFTFNPQMGLSDFIVLGLYVVTLTMLVWTGPTKAADQSSGA